MRPHWEDFPYVKTPEMIERDRQLAHDRERARIGDERRGLARPDRPLRHPMQIARYPADAMAVVAVQIGVDEAV